jgi:pantoate--beta-alanine ligase
MVPCLLGLGSNLGDRVENLSLAIAAIRKRAGIRFASASSFHETTPVGGPPGQTRYLNAAVAIETHLSAEALFTALVEIERKLGRERTERWGPRTIDLDLLLYGDALIESPALTVPHPRMSERRFVLAPAAEIAADWRHPGSSLTIGQMLAALPDESEKQVGMRVILAPREIQRAVRQLRLAGQRIGLVPTMGALHEGHLSLVRIAREHADKVVATIFVNPTQFGPQEDLGKYPRTLEADLTSLSAAGCDLVFVPTTADVYPPGFSTYVEPPAVAQPLEGVCRPGHFRGVATVVLKLFHLIPADVACFGQKDFQQLAVICHMVRDLAIPIEIMACPTVRETDGLALSSRNRYLSPAERQRALALSRALGRAAELVGAGERTSDRLVEQMRSILAAAGIDKIDYVAIADPETLADKPVVKGPTVALIAAFVGRTRLIDNRMLTT